MPRTRSRLVVALAVGAGLAWPGGAHAEVFGVPQFTLAPFTKAAGGNGLGTVALTWLPPSFNPATRFDKQVIHVRDLDSGAQGALTVGPTASSWPVLLGDGHRYAITVIACQTNTCTVASPSQTSGITRIDATPPIASVQINAGATATNDRAVALNVTATDPLIGGIPDSSSGVTQAAIDVDGDGTTPCDIFGDTSGCAVGFAPTLRATLTPGDGIKAVRVTVGDGARVNSVPCPPPFCVPGFVGAIAGNASASAVDTILLDTAKPVAVASQDRAAVDRGGAVVFSATASGDPGGPAASGVDPTSATWAFKDGTPPATGARVAHAFAQVGTFVGELRVRDRAGNLSDPRAFSVTVTPGAGATAVGTLGSVAGRAAFRIDRLRVRARYVRGRLVGSIVLHGSSAQPGALRAELRRRAGRRPVAVVGLRRLGTGPFRRTLRLPPRLAPGRYRLTFAGPGGSLATTLTLRPPRGRAATPGPQVRRASSSSA
jgi:hypothetical protein